MVISHSLKVENVGSSPTPASNFAPSPNGRATDFGSVDESLVLVRVQAEHPVLCGRVHGKEP